MSNAEDIVARQRRKSTVYSLASDLLADGIPPTHVESRLVSEGLSADDAHEIVSAFQAASQRAKDAPQGQDKDERLIENSDSLDACRPPTVQTRVKCERCGQEYESSHIEARPECNAESRPKWCCPTPGCNGSGFGFNILPVNRDYHDEHGDWRPLIAYFPDASRRHQVHYEFAHRFLPRYVHSNPIRFFRSTSQEAPTENVFLVLQTSP